MQCIVGYSTLLYDCVLTRCTHTHTLEKLTSVIMQAAAGPCAPAAPRASHSCGAKTENSLIITAVI